MYKYINVVVTYKNITYNGPQIAYHPSGLSVYENLNINIIASTATVANEVAEAGSLKTGGKTTITHSATAHFQLFKGKQMEAMPC